MKENIKIINNFVNSKKIIKYEKIKLTKKKKKEIKIQLFEYELKELYKSYFINYSYQDFILKIKNLLNFENKLIIQSKLNMLLNKLIINTSFYTSNINENDLIGNKYFIEIENYLSQILFNNNLKIIINNIINYLIKSRDLYKFNLISYENNKNYNIKDTIISKIIKYDKNHIYIDFLKYNSLINLENINQYKMYPKLLNNIINFNINTNIIRKTYVPIKLKKLFYNKLKKLNINTEYYSDPINFKLKYYCNPYINSNLDIGNLGNFNDIMDHSDKITGFFINPIFQYNNILNAKKQLIKLLKNINTLRKNYFIVFLIPNNNKINNNILNDVILNENYITHHIYNNNFIDYNIILFSNNKTNKSNNKQIILFNNI